MGVILQDYAWLSFECVVWGWLMDKNHKRPLHQDQAMEHMLVLRKMDEGMMQVPCAL